MRLRIKLAVWAAGGKPPPSAPHLKITQVNQPDTDLLDYVCADNEKDISHLSSK